MKTRSAYKKEKEEAPCLDASTASRQLQFDEPKTPFRKSKTRKPCSLVRKKSTVETPVRMPKLDEPKTLPTTRVTRSAYKKENSASRKLKLGEPKTPPQSTSRMTRSSYKKEGDTFRKIKLGEPKTSSQSTSTMTRTGSSYKKEGDTSRKLKLGEPKTAPTTGKTCGAYKKENEDPTGTEKKSATKGAKSPTISSSEPKPPPIDSIKKANIDVETKTPRPDTCIKNPFAPIIASAKKATEHVVTKTLQEKIPTKTASPEGLRPATSVGSTKEKTTKARRHEEKVTTTGKTLSIAAASDIKETTTGQVVAKAPRHEEKVTTTGKTPSIAAASSIKETTTGQVVAKAPRHEEKVATTGNTPSIAASSKKITDVVPVDTTGDDAPKVPRQNNNPYPKQATVKALMTAVDPSPARKKPAVPLYTHIATPRPSLADVRLSRGKQNMMSRTAFFVSNTKKAVTFAKMPSMVNASREKENKMPPTATFVPDTKKAVTFAKMPSMAVASREKENKISPTATFAPNTKNFSTPCKPPHLAQAGSAFDSQKYQSPAATVVSNSSSSGDEFLGPAMLSPPAFLSRPQDKYTATGTPVRALEALLGETLEELIDDDLPTPKARSSTKKPIRNPRKVLFSPPRSDYKRNHFLASPVDVGSVGTYSYNQHEWDSTRGGDTPLKMIVAFQTGKVVPTPTSSKAGDWEIEGTPKNIDQIDAELGDFSLEDNSFCTF